MKKHFTIFLVVFLCATFLVAGTSFNYQKSTVPKPLKVKTDLRTAWNRVLLTLAKMGYKIAKKNRSVGQILTAEEESVSGVYAMSELRKVAIVVSDYTSQLHKGKYYLEITVKFLKPHVTSVAALAHIEGLKRDINGKEKWVSLKTNGVLEMRFLNELSIMFTGKPVYSRKLPYWKKNSQEIDIKK